MGAWESDVNELPAELKKPFTELVLSIADDKFVLGHRNADWTGLAPILEEDIAFSSMAQDELAHASALYQLVAAMNGTTADRLVYARRPEEYRCAQLVEPSDEFDWALALVRNFFCDHLDAIRLKRLSASAYTPAAQLAIRLAAEERLHVEHADSWLRRLGRANGEARTRLQAAIVRLAPAAGSLVEPTEGVEHLERAGVFPGNQSSMIGHWQAELLAVAGDAGLRLELPAPAAGVIGGRRGRHGEAFGPMLEELTEVYRLEPGAAW